MRTPLCQQSQVQGALRQSKAPCPRTATGFNPTGSPQLSPDTTAPPPKLPGPDASTATFSAAGHGLIPIADEARAQPFGEPNHGDQEYVVNNCLSGWGLALNTCYGVLIDTANGKGIRPDHLASFLKAGDPQLRPANAADLAKVLLDGHTLPYTLHKDITSIPAAVGIATREAFCCPHPGCLKAYRAGCNASHTQFSRDHKDQRPPCSANLKEQPCLAQQLVKSLPLVPVIPPEPAAELTGVLVSQSLVPWTFSMDSAGDTWQDLLPLLRETCSDLFAKIHGRGAFVRVAHVPEADKELSGLAAIVERLFNQCAEITAACPPAMLQCLVLDASPGYMLPARRNARR